MLSPELAADVMSILEAKIRMCRKCPLSRLRTNAVPGEGPVPCQIVFVGEAPGAEEDAQGRPFVGRAGKYMDEVLGRLGLSRKDIFITNVLKCRPPENRDPRPEEVEACTPYLERQLMIIRPRVVVTLGRHALNYVLRWTDVRGSVSRLHGTVIRLKAPFGKSSLVPLYHPAVLLYRPAMKEVFERDFRALGEVVDRVFKLRRRSAEL